jgi:heme-degrading monooxygenase HmoA
MANQIVRVWKGYGTQSGVERYCHEHFQNSVLPHLRSIDGFVDARVLTRAGRDETEVVVATVWESFDSVKAFAGENYEAAVVEPVVRELLNRFDDRVRHFTLQVASRNS